MQAFTQQAQLQQQQQQALGQQQMGIDQYGQQAGYGHQQAASNMAYGQQAQQSSFTHAGQQQGSAQASTAVPGFRDPYAASAGQQAVAAATPATGGSTIQFDQYGQPYTVTKDTFTAPSANPYAAYAQQQQQQQQQQQEAQRKAMLEQQQKQLEAQREAQRQDQLKKQQVCHAMCSSAACGSAACGNAATPKKWCVVSTRGNPFRPAVTSACRLVSGATVQCAGALDA